MKNKKSPVRKRGAKRVYILNKRPFTSVVCGAVHTAFKFLTINHIFYPMVLHMLLVIVKFRIKLYI